jgi:acyl-CoA synthetase (AMP-forming)/AMP-acid ligase II
VLPDNLGYLFDTALAVTPSAGENVYPKDVEDILLQHHVRRFLLERGAPYAHPRRVVFLGELPLGGAGKIDRTGLKALARETAR